MQGNPRRWPRQCKEIQGDGRGKVRVEGKEYRGRLKAGRRAAKASVESKQGKAGQGEARGKAMEDDGRGKKGKVSQG
jgi:hypothetical protein